MSSNERIAIVGGVRTPFARARSVYQNMTAANLGGIALRETVSQTGIDPKLIDEVYFGIVSAPAEGSNIARESLFDSGLPQEIACTGINRYCASSIESAAALAAKITAGQIDIGIAGGAESISSIRALFSLQATNFFQDVGKAKTMSQRLGLLAHIKPGFFAPHAPGIKEPTTGLTMGQSADLMARLFKVGRKEQDEFALASHQKAHAAWEADFFKSHVCKVATPEGKVVERDTDVRSDSSMEKLGKLKPVFYKDGTITAGNASPLTDGASAILMMKESRAQQLGLKPIGFITGYHAAAINIQTEPLLIGPVYAIPKALKQAGTTWDQIDLFEFHEAFAAQVLSTFKAIESPEFARDKLGLSAPVGKIDMSKTNLNGGSTSIGHPFGATGGRLILQTLHQLKRMNKRRGLISVCAAGGIGAVMIVEANV
ncbi:MAG: acetyl-CoA C-acyltransferase [Bdellovibrionales bacterium]|nr:acetyl-CoA C-acyltransferase [Bdellovibrionales bacterium]